LRRARAYPAGALALLLLLAPVLGIVHGLGEAHGYCAEHQAFEERGGGTARAAEQVGVSAPPGAARDDHHEACAFAPATAAPAPLAEQPLALRAPAPRAPGLPALEAPPLPVAILRLAPKSSPPPLA
jgi:hypothetical protein